MRGPLDSASNIKVPTLLFPAKDEDLHETLQAMSELLIEYVSSTRLCILLPNSAPIAAFAELCRA